MPSSTSSSRRLTASDRPGVAQPVPVRDIPEQSWGRLLLGALVLAALLLGGWEWHWRDFGAAPGYRDDPALWARERARIDAGEGDATVLVGPSRTLFDVQLPVWEKLSGRRPIQLALEGTTPIAALEGLANDPKFTGRVLVGIAPDIVFTGFEYRGEFIRAYGRQSPSDKVGKWLSMHLIEPWFGFYHPDFALFTVIKRQDWPLRKGMEPHTSVRRLTQLGPDRATYMWHKLEDDAAYRELARSIWIQEITAPVTPADRLDNRKAQDRDIARFAAAVAKLKARGIPVLFVREPSTGPYLDYETRDFPRSATWDVLLAQAHAPGIWYDDYPELRSANYEFPEWSHMNRASAERYTVALYRIMQRDFAPADGSTW